MRRTAAFVAVAGAIIALAAPGTALAQTAPPSLSGEVFTSQNLHTTDLRIPPVCNPDGTTNVTFTVESALTGAVAIGPYPGTFEETVSVVIGPQTQAGGTGAQFGVNSGPILDADATFEIFSPTGEVSGTKSLRAEGPPLNAGPSTGACAVTRDSQAGRNFCLNEPGAELVYYEFVVVHASLDYEALINANGDQYRDEGASLLQFFLQSAECRNPITGRRVFLTSSGFRESFVSTTGVRPLAPAQVILTPAFDTNPVGTSHTVTATATTATATPVEGATILFSVEGASDVEGSCTTDEFGQCEFTYTGPQLPGADSITACADNDKDGQADPGEPCGTATKIWILPATVPGQVTGGGWILLTGQNVSFGFNVQADEAGGVAKGNCNVIDHATETHIKCLTVDSLVVTPTHATFFGQASVDGLVTDYRIDVDDLGESGVADTFKIQTDSGYTAGGVLAGGNIQIHR